MLKKSDFVGKKFRIYQGEKLEGIAKVVKVETVYDPTSEAYCEVRFDGEPDSTYSRWVALANEVKGGEA